MTIRAYLENVLDKLDKVAPSKWTELMRLPQTLLASLWLANYKGNGSVQSSGVICVPYDAVLRYMGAANRVHVDQLIQGTDLGGFVTLSQQGLCIDAADMAQVQAVLDDRFFITQDIPYFNMRGYQLIQALNTELPTVDDVHFALQAMLGDAVKTEVKGGTVIFIEPKNGQAMLVAVKDNRGAVTSTQMQLFCNDITAVRADLPQKHNNVNALNVLMLAPFAEDKDAYRTAVAHPNIYHMPPLNFVRFINRLKLDIFDKGYTQEQVAAVFDSIFPPEAISPISELRAIERLKAALEARFLGQ